MIQLFFQINVFFNKPGMGQYICQCDYPVRC